MRALPENLYRPGADPGVYSEYLGSGEALLHRLGPGAFLPMSSAGAALIFSHFPSNAWRLASGCTAFFLIVALGGLMGSPDQGLGAVLLLLLSGARHGQHGYPHSVLTLLVLIVAGFCVRHVKAPSPRRGLLLGLSIGATLLFRSTLVFFPVWLALCGGIFRRRWALVPYLFLLPWIGANWAVQHRFIPLEDGEPNRIIIDGALGFLGHGDRHNSQIAFDAGFRGSDTTTVLAWSTGQVFGDPFRYAAGYGRRLWSVILLHPFLFIMAFLGLLCSRARKEVWPVALLAAYYLLIHCFMGVDPSYFDPLWPLLAVLGASCLGGLGSLEVPHHLNTGSGRPGPLPRTRDAAASFPSAIFLGSLAFVLAACLWTFNALGAFAWAGAWSLEEQVRLFPRCGWLLSERGKSRLAAGDVEGALEDLSKARTLHPEEPLDPRLAWVWALRGEPGPLLAWEPSPQSATQGDDAGSDALVLKAHVCLKLGRTTEAREFLRAAAKKPQVLARAQALLRGRPASERLAIYSELTKTLPDSAALWLARSATALEQGDRGLARESLRRAETLPMGDAERHRIWLLYQDLKDYARALSILDRLVREKPADAELLSDRGLCRYLQGRGGPAIEDLQAALRLDPRWLPAYLTLGSIYAADGRRREALALYDQALKIPISKNPRLHALIAQSRRELE